MVDATHTYSGKWLLWRALLIAAGFTIYQCFDFYPWILDDALISFRYADNLAEGNGPVFNVGERVEGYTTFLWVVLLALGKLIGSDLIFLSRLLGSLFAAGCLLFAFFSWRVNNLIRQPAAALATLFLGTCGVFAPWAISGMEVTLFTLLTLAAVLMHIHGRQESDSNLWPLLEGLICALAALTRPEGVMLFGILWLDWLIVSIRSRNKGVLYLSLAFVVIYLPYFAWRFSYYGYLLPNTFYAKVGSTTAQVARGIDYVSRFAWVALPLLLAAFYPIIRPSWWRRYAQLRVLPVIILAFSAYSIAVGGDCMPAYRFLAPAIPLLCLLAALNLARVRRTSLLLALSIVIAGYSIYQARSDYESYGLLQHDIIAWRGQEVGVWLHYNVKPNSVIATNTAGSVPYFSGLQAIDMLGMNDEHIAHREVENMGEGFVGHEKGDGAYVLARRPDYILFGSAGGSRLPLFPSDRELYELPQFHELYQFRMYRLPSDRTLGLYELVAE